MKIKEVIQEGKNKLIENKIEDAMLIAKILMQNILKVDRSKIIFVENKELEELKKKEYEQKIEKIIKGKPLQYITNNQEFMKLNFFVNENVLIPQPDTEILVEEVISICETEYKTYNIDILDICTGSGAIGISIAKYIKNMNVTLSDISKEALGIAKRNAKSNGIEKNVDFIQSDMFENIDKKFDIIVSNPPYIETDIIETLPKQVKEEPIIALDGGKDGLIFYRILINESQKYLKNNGYLCMEIGYNQKEEVIKLAEKSNVFKKIYSKKDLSGNDRIIICKK